MVLGKGHFILDLYLVARLGRHLSPSTHRGEELYQNMTIISALIQMVEKIAAAAWQARTS